MTVTIANNTTKQRSALVYLTSECRRYIHCTHCSCSVDLRRKCLETLHGVKIACLHGTIQSLANRVHDATETRHEVSSLPSVYCAMSTLTFPTTSCVLTGSARYSLSCGSNESAAQYGPWMGLVVLMAACVNVCAKHISPIAVPPTRLLMMKEDSKVLSNCTKRQVSSTICSTSSEDELVDFRIQGGRLALGPFRLSKLGMAPLLSLLFGRNVSFGDRNFDAGPSRDRNFDSLS